MKAVQGIGILLVMRPPEEGAALRSPVPVPTLLALVVASTPAAGWSAPGLPAVAEQVALVTSRKHCFGGEAAAWC